MLDGRKVIVFASNTPFVTQSEGSGNWVNNLLEKLLKSKTEYKFVLFSLGTSSIIQCKELENGLTHYLFPKSGYSPYGKVPNKLRKDFNQLINSLHVDIIHVWGTEGPWMELALNKEIRSFKIILSIQGVVSSLKRSWYAGLGFREIIQVSFSLIELYRWQYSYFIKYLRFRRHSKLEIKALCNADVILIQSMWVQKWLKGLVPLDQLPDIRYSDKILRTNFYSAKKWVYNEKDVQQIITVSNGRPYKGLHDLIKGIAVLNKSYPGKYELSVIGYNPFEGKRLLRTGFDRFIIGLITKYNLVNQIKFKAGRNAEELISDLLSSDIFVQTSYVESYSFVLAEALYLGVPSVVSYSGALSEYDSSSCSHYPSGDIMSLANSIFSIANNENKMNNMSLRAIEYMENKVYSPLIAENHLELYESILNS